MSDSPTFQCGFLPFLMASSDLAALHTVPVISVQTGRVGANVASVSIKAPVVGLLPVQRRANLNRDLKKKF